MVQRLFGPRAQPPSADVRPRGPAPSSRRAPQNEFVRPGFELGFEEKGKYYVYNHLRFNVLVHPTHGEYLRARQGMESAALGNIDARKLLGAPAAGAGVGAGRELMQAKGERGAKAWWRQLKGWRRTAVARARARVQRWYNGPHEKTPAEHGPEGSAPSAVPLARTRKQQPSLLRPAASPSRGPGPGRGRQGAAAPARPRRAALHGGGLRGAALQHQAQGGRGH